MENTFDLTVKALREQGLNSDEILNELSKLFQKFSQPVNIAECKSSDEEKIKKLLREICVPIENKGYKCWVTAIMLYKNAKGWIKMGEIYREVAKQYQTTLAGAERVMSSAIETAYHKCGEDMFYNILGINTSSPKGLPRNKVLIAVISELI